MKKEKKILPQYTGKIIKKIVSFDDQFIIYFTDNSYLQFAGIPGDCAGCFARTEIGVEIEL